MDLLKSPAPERWFHNCLGIDTVPEGTIPQRFTPAQLADYAAAPAQEVRSRCAAGICIALTTDSAEISIDFSSGNGARSIAFFDLTVNGMLAATAGWENYAGGRNCVTFQIPHESARQEQVVHIYLPHCRELILHAVTLPDAASAAPIAAPERTLLCLGDSTTQGMTAKSPFSTVAVQLARFLDMRLLNQGVGGDVFDAVHLDALPGTPPSLITVAYGTNDWGRTETAEAFRKTAADYLKKLRDLYSASEIFVLTPIWRADWQEVRAMGSFADIAASIADVTSQFPNMTLINGLDLVPHMPEYYADGKVHPNDAGFLHYALNAARKITRIFHEFMRLELVVE